MMTKTTLTTSHKQDKSFAEATRRYNVWVGAVSSGKTHISIERLIYDLRHAPAGDAMIIAVNRTSLQRNILSHMYKQLGYPLPTPTTSMTMLYGRKVWFVGAPDVGSVATIQGSTLALAYVDEATNIPEPFWRMLESRLRVPGAKLLATCNPEGPGHWLKKDFIDNEKLDLISWDFTLDDNPALDEKYKEQLKASYYGMWYNRYILGQWALAHGAIYDCYDRDNEYSKPIAHNPDYYIVGVDYGTTNATAAVLCAISHNRWPQIAVVDEYYYDCTRSGRSKSDAELVADIANFCGTYHVTSIYVDPAAASLRVAMQQRDLPVLQADNDVLTGIKIVSKFLSAKQLVISSSCKNLKEQLQSYAWDPSAAQHGIDKPIKKNDHAVDALRYAIYTAFPRGEMQVQKSYADIRKDVYGDDYPLFIPTGGFF